MRASHRNLPARQRRAGCAKNMWIGLVPAPNPGGLVAAQFEHYSSK